MAENFGIGAPTDTAAPDDTGNYSLIAFFKRFLSQGASRRTATATETQATLALSGAAQTALAANAARKSWQIQNNSGVTVYVNVGATASSGDGKSFALANGASIGENGSGVVSTQAISILGASGSVAVSEGA